MLLHPYAPIYFTPHNKWAYSSFQQLNKLNREIVTPFFIIF